MYQQPFAIGGYVICIIIIISWLSSMTRPKGRQARTNLPEKYLQEASKWSAIARNETNLVLSLVHINYALACANVSKDLSSERDLSELMGIDFRSFVEDCVAFQDQTVRSLGTACPNVKPDVKFAIASGWKEQQMPTLLFFHHHNEDFLNIPSELSMTKFSKVHKTFVDTEYLEKLSEQDDNFVMFDEHNIPTFNHTVHTNVSTLSVVWIDCSAAQHFPSISQLLLHFGVQDAPKMWLLGNPNGNVRNEGGAEVSNCSFDAIPYVPSEENDIKGDFKYTDIERFVIYMLGGAREEIDDDYNVLYEEEEITPYVNNIKQKGTKNEYVTQYTPDYDHHSQRWNRLNELTHERSQLFDQFYDRDDRRFLHDGF